ncbi:MAG: o-succinylbenzoate--CoA ligase [Candidatus Flexifilum sp.]
MSDDWLRLAAQAQPDRLALIPDPRRADAPALTFAGLDDAVDRLAGRLAAAGLAPGLHIGWWGRSAFEGVQVILALARLGAISVPFNLRLTGNELDDQLQTARCSHLLTGTDSAPPALTVPIPVVSIGDLPQEPLALPPIDRFQPDALQGILFTSGTTGRPRAASISFGNLHASAAGSRERLGARPDDRWLLGLPLYHIGGIAMLFRSILHRVGLVEFDLSAGFDPGRLADILRDPALGVTHVSLVPTMLYRLLETGFTAPPHLRCVLVGGAAADVDLLKRASARGLPIAVTYGLTEATSQVATLPPERLLDKLGSAGRPLDGIRVSIVDERGAPLPPGAIGEIVVRGPTVFQGYLGASTSRALRDGALYTGDLGYLDADGDLCPVQRRTDLIISGGENIYPAEVEAALKSHPAVADACVVGLPSAEWGQIVGAAVVLKAEHTASETDLDRFMRARLAGYKRPRIYRFVTTIPINATGKIDRQAVRALFDLQAD